MEIRVLSIKKAIEDLKRINTSNIKIIIASSYDIDIDFISDNNKLILNFDDITTRNKTSFNKSFAKEIHSFINNIDFEKYKLYICCDSGISRSSAIAAAILRKYNEDENLIWKDYNYHPNILVYKILCDEFKLRNTEMRLRIKEKENIRALRRQINKARKISNNLFDKLLNI